MSLKRQRTRTLGMLHVHKDFRHVARTLCPRLLPNELSEMTSPYLT